MTYLVAVEGLNGVGKTTLARSVAAALGATYTRTPPTDVMVARGYFDDDPFSAAAMFFYLSWVKLLSDEVEAGRYGPILLCDRYLPSTHAYFAAAGRDIGPVVDALSIRPPDLTVLLLAAEPVRRERLSGRPVRALEEATMRDPFRQAVLNVYRGYQPLAEIDTTARTAQESCTEALTTITLRYRSAVRSGGEQSRGSLPPDRRSARILAEFGRNPSGPTDPGPTDPGPTDPEPVSEDPRPA